MTSKLSTSARAAALGAAFSESMDACIKLGAVYADRMQAALAERARREAALSAVTDAIRDAQAAKTDDAREAALAEAAQAGRACLDEFADVRPRALLSMWGDAKHPAVTVQEARDAFYRYLVAVLKVCEAFAKMQHFYERLDANSEVRALLEDAAAYKSDPDGRAAVAERVRMLNTDRKPGELLPELEL